MEPQVTTPSDSTAATRVAVELLNVWLERDTPPIQAVQYIYNVLEAPETPGIKQVILGQLHLAELLLLMLAKARGANPYELRAKAHELLRWLSEGLPE
jgi:hypothetical protein